MATIITVHGTGATGPEEGQAWWQKGSAFEQHIRELVESEDGTLNFQPMVWDGNNSEASRRVAAAKLYDVAKQLEREGQKYSLIGHSHGGSVVANALLLGASKGNKLPQLARCITVGTPFIQSVKSFWLFSRLGLLGKSALVSVAACGFFLTLYMMPRMGSVISPFMLFLPFFGLYTCLWILNWKALFMYRPKILRFFANTFAARLVSLHHKNDEAINGLGSLKNMEVQIFRRDFAVGAFSFISLFVLPVLAVAIAMSPSLSVKITTLAAVSDAAGADFITRLSEVGLSIVKLPTKPIITYLFRHNMWRPSETIELFFMFPLTVFIASLVITYFVILGSRLVSSAVSVNLNRLTWSQIRRVGFGNDALGELSVNACNSCPWVASAWLSLPEQLAKEISNLANLEAPTALVKFREGISKLALAKDKEANEFFFSEYLTWDELIHCSYFGAPRFRMLVAYAIATSPGFRPTAALKSHPDYVLVARWYEEIHPKKE
jgi:hypothetical protein